MPAMKGRASSLALRLLVCSALLGTGIVAAICAPAAASASPIITEFTATPEEFNFPIQPQEITAGPDGNLWYTDGSPHVYKMSPSGAIIGFYPTTGGAEGIVADDGALWVTGVKAEASAASPPQG
jgi:streptogramin lyase